MLVADSIGKRYGDRWVIRAATLRALPGQVRALVGRNGIGKSTLLKIAAGVLAPDYGTVHFAGNCVVHPSLPRMARAGLFYLPDHDLLSEGLSVEDHLRSAAHGRRREDIGRVVTELRLDAVRHSRPWQLSGGERRRTEFAVAMLRHPRCLLADEPLRGIAPLDTELLLSVMRRMAGNGCAVVVSGHEIAALIGAADHLTWCTDGTTYELGSPGAAVAHVRFRQMYLGDVPIGG